MPACHSPSSHLEGAKEGLGHWCPTSSSSDAFIQVTMIRLLEEEVAGGYDYPVLIALLLEEGAKRRELHLLYCLLSCLAASANKEGEAAC